MEEALQNPKRNPFFFREGEFQLLAESMPQLVWVVNANGDSEYCNQRWYNYLNVKVGNHSKDVWTNALHPEDREKIRQVWNHSYLTGEPYEIEYRFRNGTTGEFRWFLVRATAIRDDAGKVVKWFGTSTDIHEQKVIIETQTFLAEASKVLSSSLDYLKTLDQVAQLAVPSISDWCTVELIENGQVSQISVAHKDPAKVSWAKNLSKKRKIDMDSNRGFPKVIKTGKSVFYPIITDEMIVAAAKNKKELNLIKGLGFTSVIIVPITIQDKTIGVIQLVSAESKKRFNEFDLYMAEELGRRAALAIQNAQLYELAQNKEKQFKALYDSNIIGVLYSNLSGKITDANDAFLQMIGYTRKDILSGKIRWDKLTPPEYQKENQRASEEIMKDGVAVPWEKEYIRRDGSQVPVIIGSVLLNKKTTQILSFVLDITERKKLEQRKDEFIGITSHELKTPLTSIKGYVQILERIINEMGDQRMSEYVQKTNVYIDRLSSLIVDLLDVSKIQAGKLPLEFSTFDAQELIDESTEGVQQINKSHKISRANEAHFDIRADRHRLEQVLTNLLTNAVKYSPQKKKVVVHVKKNEHDIIIGVQDFGIGVSEKEISKIFDRFYRVESVSKKFSGLGIGLYISYEIVQRHNGKMWVESTLGKGSTFFFSIPIQPSTKI